MINDSSGSIVYSCELSKLIDLSLCVRAVFLFPFKYPFCSYRFHMNMDENERIHCHLGIDLGTVSVIENDEHKCPANRITYGYCAHTPHFD